ncbi:ribulose-phosphate 3-epimerase [Candidatus Woesearchaeota archaeon]|nr:ribulose-phosphate 3-epimerase [Candidatus Woesearchaeota archaeon]
MAKVLPSILSADFSRLGEEVSRLEPHVDGFHFDVMDGHFVPNITYGPVVLEAVRKCTRLPIEADLMIDNPAFFIEDFARAGADIITVHVEADRHLHRTLKSIRELGKVPGVSLNPSTPLSAVEHVLEDVGIVLVMTVNPGFGGQRFIESMVPKIRRLRELMSDKGLKVEIEVDGGINQETGRKCVSAGADILVAGSYIYKGSDPVANARLLKSLK